jgi:hypothetical protein
MTRRRHLVNALAFSMLISGACSPEDNEVVSSFEWVHYGSIDEMWADSVLVVTVEFGDDTRTEAVVTYPEPMGPSEGDPESNPNFGMDPDEAAEQEAHAREFAEENPDVYTIYQARLVEVFKGTASADETIEVRQHGGTYEGVRHVVTDQHTYERGGSYLLFLRADPRVDGVPAIALNPYQGVYPVASNGSLELLPPNDIEITFSDLEQLAAAGD